MLLIDLGQTNGSELDYYLIHSVIKVSNGDLVSVLSNMTLCLHIMNNHIRSVCIKIFKLEKIYRFHIQWRRKFAKSGGAIFT